MLDTYADSHLATASSAADSTASEKGTHVTAKYITIARMHHVIPVAIEMPGVFDNEVVQFVHQFGQRCTEMTGNPKETSYLFQQMSVAIQER